MRTPVAPVYSYTPSPISSPTPAFALATLWPVRRQTPSGSRKTKLLQLRRNGFGDCQLRYTDQYYEALLSHHFAFSPAGDDYQSFRDIEANRCP